MFETLSVAKAMGSVSTPQKRSDSFAGVRGAVLWERNNDGPVTYVAPNHHTLSIYQGGGAQTWCCETRSWGFASAICLLPQGYDSSWQHRGFVRNLHLYFTDQDLEALNGRASGDPAPLIYGRNGVLTKLGAIMARDLDWTDAGDRLTIDQLVLALLSQISRAETTSAARLPGRSLDVLEERMVALEDGVPALAELAQELSMSARHLARLYKATTGQTLATRQREIQMDQARALLRGDLSLREVALACGFSSQSHFTTAFRQATGTTPAAWRRL